MIQITEIEAIILSQNIDRIIVDEHGNKLRYGGEWHWVCPIDGTLRDCYERRGGQNIPTYTPPRKFFITG